MENKYILSLADQTVPVLFRHPETALYFNSFARLGECSDCINYLAIPESDAQDWIENYGMIDNGSSEFGLSIYRVSDYLSQFKICLIHGAALLWHGKAYLFCADSGVGKSTQLIRWMQLYHDEVKVMNGDKPVIKMNENGKVTVHPSPWKGKEEWGDDSIIAPLGGIILLEQADHNEITTRDKHQTAFRVVAQIFSRYELNTYIHNHCQIAETIVKNVPIWRLRNKGDLESAMITHDALVNWEKENGL